MQGFWEKGVRMHGEENLHELIAELEIIVRLTYVGDCQNVQDMIFEIKGNETWVSDIILYINQKHKIALRTLLTETVSDFRTLLERNASGVHLR